MRRSSSTRAIVALDAIRRLAGEDGRSTQETIEEIVLRVGQVVGADTFFAAATDPETGLCLGAGMSYNMPESVCHPFWEHEFLVPDYNKFVDLDVEDPVADLRQATGGRLSRSPRYRVLNELADLEDEVRARFVAGGRGWGELQLNRTSGGRPFDAGDLGFLRAVAPLAGAALRRTLLVEADCVDPWLGPGVVVLDERAGFVSATAEAETWLGDLAVSWRRYPGNGRIHPELLTMALAALDDSRTPERRARLRTADGTWLVAHASPLRDSRQVALTVGPAKASQIAPVIIDAYGLTAREGEVTRLVARGLSTDEIATELTLSRHTVRGYLKAIFEKVGVTSRGELTSKLFAEHSHPPLVSAITESSARVHALLERR